MRSSLGKIVLAVFFLPVLAASQTSAPGKVPRAGTPPASASQTAAPAGVTHAAPSPTPTPPRPNPGVAPAPISTGPQYSPAQLDFGSLWDGESAKRTLTLTPPLDGIVTVSFPGGGQFWLTEYRVSGPLSGGSKNTPMRQNGPISQWQVKARNTFAVGKSIPGYYPQMVAAGDQIQIDIVFQPVSHPTGTAFVVPPGPKSIVIGIIGPGSTKSWSVQIPARGVFNGSRFQ